MILVEEILNKERNDASVDFGSAASESALQPRARTRARPGHHHWNFRHHSAGRLRSPMSGCEVTLQKAIRSGVARKETMF